MNVAIFTVCPDAKQLSHLSLVRSSWEQYGRRHALNVFVVEQIPNLEHAYWGKYFPLELPEYSRFDAALVLDNDVLINPASPSILEGWDPGRVRMGDEREQFGWSLAYVRRYFAYYELAVPAEIAEPRVLNSGVILYTREHGRLFREIYERWRDWRQAASTQQRARDPFKYSADQSRVGLALQTADLVQPLEMKFNRLWWSWWQNRGRRPEWPFKIYAKSSKLLTPWLPQPWASRLAEPGLRVIERALAENHFLHFAGSKSPLHLLRHRSSHGQ